MPADFGRRFEELLKQAEVVETSKRTARTEYGVGTYIESTALLNWQVKVRHLLIAVSGADSQHFKLFVKAEEPSMYTTDYDLFQRMHAVFLAAKEDYEGGYLHSIRDLIQAAVFDSELEQAEELHAAG